MPRAAAAIPVHRDSVEGIIGPARGIKRQTMPAMEAIDLLIKASARLLCHAESLLETLDAATYTASPPEISPHRVGGHVRHILEFYECFLDGAPEGRIDYDARRRDATVEGAPGAALRKAREIKQRLRNALLDGGAGVKVKMEDGECFLASSVERELQVLNSHAVHHFALIALALRALGIRLDDSFGMVPSTLRHLEESAKCAR